MLASDVYAAASAHAIEAYPQEACGAVVSGAYVRLRNVANDPAVYFAIDPNELHDAVADGVLEWIIHSHPNGPAHPTEMDMRHQAQDDVPWAIIPTDGKACMPAVCFGDSLPIPDLIGRPFVHGVTDCYALIRDWYQVERGVRLPNFPRDDEWWNSDGNLYLDGFQEAGFRRITRDEAQPGDVFLAQIRSPVPNHGGILLDHGLALHHLANRLSRREPIGPWLGYVTYWLRHGG